MIGRDDPPPEAPCECCHPDEGACDCCPRQSCIDRRESEAQKWLDNRDAAKRGDRAHAALRKILIELSRPGGISTDAIGAVIFEYFSEEQP